MEDSPRPLMQLRDLNLSKFTDAWRVAHLAALVIPFLVFLIALLMTLEMDFFRMDQLAITVVYTITVVVSLKLMTIGENLHGQGKLLPIRFLLSCYALYCVVIILFTGFTPDVVMGNWFEGEFAQRNAQVGVLLLHTAILGLASSLSFTYWVNILILERTQQHQQESTDSVDVVKDPAKDEEVQADDYQVL